MAQRKNQPAAWVLAVDMGYGHQRAAHPLDYLAVGGEVILANTYRGIPKKDQLVWEQSRRFYEFISRFKNVPLVGEKIFEFYDKLQSIPQFYPRRDLSKPNFQLRQIYQLIKNQDWGRHLINRLAKNPLPLITTFFVTAFMAEEFNYPGEIYCLVTDTDISRAWAPLYPNLSRINYFAPSYRVVERLILYGVSADRIHLTGFPLPMENIGGLETKILRQDIARRLVNLDPAGRYRNRYQAIVKKYLGIKNLPQKSGHLLTLMFAVGGAGAQKEIGAEIVKSLKVKIKQKRIKVVLVAGIHNSVSSFFRQVAIDNGLREEIGHGLEIIFSGNKEDYFNKFDQALRATDILWTKPSELSFYTALGLPIIIAPPIGSQELFNRKWLRTIGCGVNQYEPEYTHEWLFDWVNSGWLAEATMQGFIEAPKFGTYNIEKIISKKPEEAKEVKTILQY
ncbi:MAG: hypothetical protein A2744_04000 [Candidatus Buchananbacteria bacterium RIFCSPHIGHO2_01_FULL_44_11]|uniref:DUF6938 domain-containing protein n=1 Tax=Candidatus Buchananbacteria bacterium RIFCSPHIGHO2_01_FULL_44_11 TaxID=1797535 RepID=A0A1G1Y146_9BACT|nr:MAG: hypothetical protein A2744_04000 [Candidatus Buchananbacteria bacterium RIFCSPHIGHO2_01_FULL_44_11]